METHFVGNLYKIEFLASCYIKVSIEGRQDNIFQLFELLLFIISLITQSIGQTGNILDLWCIYKAIGYPLAVAKRAY